MAFQLPPLHFAMSSAATSGMDMGAAQFGASFGDWNVNVAGSGTASQSATSSAGINWLWIAAAGAAWLLLRK